MKLQRLVWGITLGVTALLTGLICWQLNRIQDRILDNPGRRVSFGNLSVAIPSGLDHCRDRTHEGWQVTEYCKRGFGTFQLAVAHGDDESFQDAARRYFHLPAWPMEKRIYRAAGMTWFAESAPLLDNGIYIMKMKGKRRSYIYFFTFNDTYYWMELTTWKSISPYAELFNRAILSLMHMNEPMAGQGLEAKLSRMCRDSWFLFCQPLEIFLVLPFSIVLLALGINSLVNRRMGRLPDVQALATVQPLISESHVAMTATVRGKKNLSTVALAVSHDGLHLFQFGKPFLALSREQLQTQGLKVDEGIAGRFLEFRIRPDQLRNPPPRLLQGGPTWTVRLYCRECDRVMSYLS